MEPVRGVWDWEKVEDLEVLIAPAGGKFGGSSVIGLTWRGGTFAEFYRKVSASPPPRPPPIIFFSSHSQVIRPPPTHAYILTPSPFSASLSVVSASGSFGSHSALGRCWGTAVGGYGGARAPPCAAAEGPAGRLVPAPGGWLPRSGRDNPHLSGFPRCRGQGLQRRGGRGNYPPGSIQAHPNSVPLSQAPRSHPRAPPGSGFPKDPHVSGLGRGEGTASSCQAGGLRSEKAIFRGGGSGEAKH